MGNWIIHVVGETIDDDLAPAISKFIKEIQSLSHKVTQVRLTTDTGEKVIHVANDVGDVITTLDPASTSTVAGVEKTINSEVTSHELPAPIPTTPGLSAPDPSFKTK
jgi:hypothetical protein